MSIPTRREVSIGSAAAAFSGFMLVPRSVLGGAGHVPPSAKVNVAIIGAGGRGGHLAMLADYWEVDREERDLDIPEHEELSGKWNEAVKYERRAKESLANIVALCDVDGERSAKTRTAFPKARFFKDYRQMLDTMKGSLDGVLVATPDHSHFHATMAVLQAGLPAYTEKPLTRYVAHARKLTEAAQKYKVPTQMGNQGHSNWSTARIRDWVLSGSIGQVREVVAWNSGNTHATGPRVVSPVPEWLDYDLWLNREPHRSYHAGPWRAWSYFSTGTLGDFGCHTLDASFYALDLRYPERVEVTTAGEWPERDSFPAEQLVTWYVPSRGSLPPVRMRYFLASPETIQAKVAPLLEHLPPGTQMRTLFRFGRGAAIIGEKATILHGGWGAQCRIAPEDKAKQIGLAPERSPKVDGHMRTWLKACKGEAKPLSDFAHAGPLAELVLLGDVALRSKNKVIHWAAKSMKVTNDREANELVYGPKPRPGWRL